MEGPALTWLRHGSPNKYFDTTLHDFGRAQGTDAGIAMCGATMTDQDIVGLLPKADSAWKARHGGSRLFGTNYQE
eukprot:15042737-Ditylum_brightwellii.AAC.1